MSWFWLIFIATNLFAINNLLDKFFCAQKFKNICSFGVITSLLSGIFILILAFFVDFSGFIGWPLFLSLLSGPLYFLMWLLFWRALTTGEASRTTAIFNTAPVFNAFLAVILLREKLTSLKWLAIFLIVAGAVLCSLEKADTGRRRFRFNKVYLIVVLSAIINAFANIATKMASFQVSSLAIYPISFLGGLPFYLLPLMKKEIFSEIKTNFKNRKIVGGLFLRSLIAFTAVCLFYLALDRGPVSLIVAVGGIGPLFVFLYATLASRFRPDLIKEELTCQALFAKALAVIFIVSGVILINQ